jgi:N4-gp56 family major capsid protein
MAQTIIGINDPKAVKRYSGYLAVDVARTSYFSRKFMGEGESSSMPIQRLTHLENDAGEQITYDLSMQLKMQPVEGDAVLEGKEEELKFYTDALYIDQLRGGVNTGGRMTRKRTLHDLRNVSRKRQKEWWSRVFDELFFMYISGARGVNTEFVFPTTYTGFANNALTAPDSDHIIYAGGTTKATLASTNKMALSEIDKAVAYATMMGGGTQEVPKIQPIMIDGEKHYVCVMNPWQVFDVRTNSSTGQWLDIQKAAASAEGKSSPIFKGGLGMYNNVVLHEHEGIIRFSDYGSGSNVAAARALFMGVQACVVAFGSPGSGLRFDWNEETRDNGNQVVITTSTICGIKKTTFNGNDFGVMAIDTAAARP